MGRLQRKKNLAKVKRKSNKSLSIDSSTDTYVSIDSTLSVSKNKRQYNVVNRPTAVKSRNNFFKSCFAYIRDSNLELKKVVWPSKKQTIGSTFVVIVLVGLLSAFLGTVDAGLSGIIRSVLK